MANSSTSALSYALELLSMPNLTLNEEQRKSLEAVYQGYSVFVWVKTGFGNLAFATKHRDRVQERATW